MWYIYLVINKCELLNFVLLIHRDDYVGSGALMAGLISIFIPDMT